MSKKIRIISSESTEERRQKINFDGVFTDTLRVCFKTHRLGLRVSLVQLADFLHINWSTIRKWESGDSKRCHPRHIGRVNDFLNGVYDSRLELMKSSEVSFAELMERVPVELRSCFERAWLVFGVCCISPGKEIRLLKSLDNLLEKTSRNLLNVCVTGRRTMDDKEDSRFVAESKKKYNVRQSDKPSGAGEDLLPQKK